MRSNLEPVTERHAHSDPDPDADPYKSVNQSGPDANARPPSQAPPQAPRAPALVPTPVHTTLLVTG